MEVVAIVVAGTFSIAVLVFGIVDFFRDNLKKMFMEILEGLKNTILLSIVVGGAIALLTLSSMSMAIMAIVTLVFFVLFWVFVVKV